MRAETTIVPEGSVFVQSVNATGTQATPRQVNSSEFINSTAGGNLHVGTEVAVLTPPPNFSIARGETLRAR